MSRLRHRPELSTGIGGSPFEFDVTEFGAVGQGSDDTDAFQLALDAVDDAEIPQEPSFFIGSQSLYVPAGNYLVGKLTWKGQSIVGDGSGNTIITGKPGEDIFFGDSTAGQDQWMFKISGLTLNVDDSVDVSGSLNRSGVGNAGIVVEYNDGSGTLTGKWLRCALNDVLFRSTSYTDLGQNASAGEYFQGRSKQSCDYQHVRYERLANSLYEDAPNINPTSAEIFRDYSHYWNLFVNGCENGPRFVNNGYSVISGVQIGRFNTGLVLTGIQSQLRSESFACTIPMWFEEQSGGTGTNAMQLDGRSHVLFNITISGQVNGSKITLNADGCSWIGANLSNADNTSGLTVAGDRNNISGLNIRNNNSLPVDTGRGNNITIRRVQTSAGSGGENFNAAYSTPPTNVRDIDAIHRGHTLDPYLSSRNLLADPSQLAILAGTGNTVAWVADSTTDFGSINRITSTVGSDGKVNWSVSGANTIGFPNGLVIPEFLPAAYVRIFVKAKLDVAESATLRFLVDAVQQTGAKSISWTTSYTIGYIDVDLSGLTGSSVLTLSMNNTVGATATTMDIAWIAFQPIAVNTLSRHLLLEDGVTAPATEAAYAQIYVDSADGDLKVKFGDGTVKTIVVDT